MDSVSRKGFTAKEFSIDDFQEELLIASPGRINLIGEHTDYNDGFALPTSIDKKIYFYLKRNHTNTNCNIYSISFDSHLKVDLSYIEKSAVEWENYILGVLYGLLQKTSAIKGFDCIIESKLPIGSGVSSSAALECGLAFGLNELFKLELSKEVLIKISRDAEHTFVGTKCGIMDQFASMMGKKKHVILLDCKSLEPEWIPFHLDPYKILLLNTNVTHNLASSEYNVRRKECEQGIEIIQKKYSSVKSLRDVTLDILSEFRTEMSNVVYKRCQYVINENDKVKAAATALKKDDIHAFGKIMYASHEGQRYEYEISCPELDFLVEFSKNYNYILGSRMMGGGFGGCTINIIHQDHIKEYTKMVSIAYYRKFDLQLDAFIVMPDQGTSIEKRSK